MLAKELARELGRIFRSELDGLLVDMERGVRRVEREYAESLRTEFGEEVQEADADRVARDFRSACKRRPLITFMFFTGCRLGAAQKITWAMVNRDATEIELPGEITKSGDPLVLPLVGKGLDRVSAMLQRMFRKDGPVFCTMNLRKAWYRACEKLGLGTYDKVQRHYQGLTVHDLRRSAVRNLIRAGVPRGVAMTITGHKTEAVFERYNITDSADVRDALVKVGQYATIAARKAKRA